MLFLKNITEDELLDFATEIIQTHSTEKSDDMIQIAKFRERLKQNIKDDPWISFIEGWCTGLGSKHNISIEKYIKKRKLEQLDNL